MKICDLRKKPISSHLWLTNQDEPVVIKNITNGSSQILVCCLPLCYLV